MFSPSYEENPDQTENHEQLHVQVKKEEEEEQQQQNGEYAKSGCSSVQSKNNDDSDLNSLFNEGLKSLSEKLASHEVRELGLSNCLLILDSLLQRFLSMEMVDEFLEERQTHVSNLFKARLEAQKHNNEVQRRFKEESKQAIVLSREGIPSLIDDSESDLASVVKRRQSHRGQEERRRLEEEEKQRKQKEWERCKAEKDLTQSDKNYEKAYREFQSLLRLGCLGQDRFCRRYWIFGNAGDYIFVDDATESSEAVVGWSFFKTADIENLLGNLNVLGERESLLRDELKRLSERFKRSKEKEPDDVGQKAMLISDNENPEEEKETSALDHFIQELIELELQVRNGGLGGVSNYDEWLSILQKCSSSSSDSIFPQLKDSLLQCQDHIHLRFLQLGCHKRKQKSSCDNETIPSINLVQRENELEAWIGAWRDQVSKAQTLSRLIVMLNVLEASISWDKSIANARCRICRHKPKRKEDRAIDDEQLLLCDHCNMAFHMFCLRPALETVPPGDWYCSVCKPLFGSPDDEVMEREGNRKRNVNYFDEEEQDPNDEQSKDEEEEEEEKASESEHEGIINDDLCLICESGELQDCPLIKCGNCPNSFHANCHEPPLRYLPRSEWQCSDCRRGTSLRKSKFKAQKRKGNKNNKKAPKLSRGGRRRRKRVILESSEEEDDDNDDERDEEERRVLVKVLKALFRHRASAPFHDAVDEDDVPDYYTFITDPVDLSTLQEAVKEGSLCKAPALVERLRQMFKNCENYNTKASREYEFGQKLEEFFVSTLLTDLLNVKSSTKSSGVSYRSVFPRNRKLITS